MATAGRAAHAEVAVSEMEIHRQIKVKADVEDVADAGVVVESEHKHKNSFICCCIWNIFTKIKFVLSFIFIDSNLTIISKTIKTAVIF